MHVMFSGTGFCMRQDWQGRTGRPLAAAETSMLALRLELQGPELLPHPATHTLLPLALLLCLHAQANVLSSMHLSVFACLYGQSFSC